MAVFQRRHYELIAETISNSRDLNVAGITAKMAAVRALAETFAEDNPHFDRDRFIEACTEHKYRAKHGVSQYA